MFYHRVSVMEAGVITPVLLLLLSAEQEPRQRALGVLESFLVRRMICRQSTMGFNRLVLELVNQLHEGGMENVDRTTAGLLCQWAGNQRSGLSQAAPMKARPDIGEMD